MATQEIFCVAGASLMERDELLADGLRHTLTEQGAVVPYVEVQQIATIPKTAASKAPLNKSAIHR